MKTLLKIASLCSYATAITTFFLWLLPRLYGTPESFIEAVQLADNSYYMSRLWINFFHIPLALTAYIAFAYTLIRRESLKMIFGTTWLVIWGIVEMIGVSGLIFVVNKNWRSDFLAATASQKAVLQNNIESYLSLWDSLFFVLLIAFLLGTIFYGWASWNGKGLEKLLSYFFWLAAPLTLFIILGRYFDAGWTQPLIAWIYPLLQPISRFTLGLYLWKYGSSETFLKEH